MRRRQIIDTGGHIDTPPLHDFEGAEDLALALLAAGITEPGGMAEQPLSWPTLEAWARLTEAHLSPGDFETIRGLSEVYLMAAEEYRHKQMPPPYDVVEINRQALGRAISAALRRH